MLNLDETFTFSLGELFIMMSFMKTLGIDCALS